MNIICVCGKLVKAKFLSTPEKGDYIRVKCERCKNKKFLSGWINKEGFYYDVEHNITKYRRMNE